VEEIGMFDGIHAILDFIREKNKKIKGWCPYNIRVTDSILEKLAENATFDQSPPFWWFPTNSAITPFWRYRRKGETVDESERLICTGSGLRVKNRDTCSPPGRE
jgi:hypothetical protein